MIYSIYLTPTAINDIQDGLEFYNSHSANLGFRFADEVDDALQAIAIMPTTYSYRYKNVRGKQVKNFLILFFIS